MAKEEKKVKDYRLVDNYLDKKTLGKVMELVKDALKLKENDDFYAALVISHNDKLILESTLHPVGLIRALEEAAGVVRESVYSEIMDKFEKKVPKKDIKKDPKIN